MGKDQVSDAFRDCVVRRLQYEQAEARYGGAVPLPINNNVKQVETQLFNTAFNDDEYMKNIVNYMCDLHGIDRSSGSSNVNQFFKRSVEKRLNDAFSRLGREINDLSFTLKRRLPRRESERKEHPLSRYMDTISSLETRYTLLSMTYKRYMDAGLSCFVPGKVLDLSFTVLNIIRDYVKRDVYVQPNVANLMRDLRDFATMATEHFDLFIAPMLNKRQDPCLRRSMFSPAIRSTTNNFMASIYGAFHCNSLPNQVEYNSEYMSPMQNSINKLSEQLDDIQKLMNAQNGITRQVGQLLSEVSPYLTRRKQTKASALAHRLSTNLESLQEVLNTSIPVSNKSLREATSDWFSKRQNKVPDPSELLKSPKSTDDNPESSTSNSTTSGSRYPLRNRLASPAHPSETTTKNTKSRKRQRTLTEEDERSWKKTC